MFCASMRIFCSSIANIRVSNSSIFLLAILLIIDSSGRNASCSQFEDMRFKYGRVSG